MDVRENPTCLRKAMIVLAAAAALTGGLTADAFALASGHAGPFGEFVAHPIRQSDTRSQPATEFHGENAATFRSRYNSRTR
jgi:hypothetical protein